ncbi:anti-sigma factor family protein [Paenibacillus glycinis]|uniref:Putative zinc-finger domain-containing protein n=1 Tax=Paenibacillus glycinis TaxID=2697035 RepID=A0ABW9XJW9_9BACL|nr:zf-HC2 domain-containing protein [Paenibacillus glycinis]NBD22892.1 hypothetical protein [Paenibacillus glycinis]
MNCQEVMDYMQRQLDGDLDERETEILMNHTRHCSDCAAMFERLKLLSSGLESLPRVAPSYSLVDAILPKLAEIQAAAEAAVEPPRIVIAGEGTNPPRRVQKQAGNWRRWLPLSAIGGTVAAGVIIGMFFLSNNGMHSLRDSNDSGLAADTGSANASVMDEARTNSGDAADSSSDASAAKENGSPAAHDKGTSNDKVPVQQNMVLKSEEGRAVDPNGEAMPPITSGGQDGDAAGDQANSPNYATSDSGGSAGGNAPASGSSEGSDSADGGQTGGAGNAAADSADAGQASVPGPGNEQKVGSLAPQVMASPISPDKQYQAFIVDGDTVSVYTVSDSELKYQSATKRTGIADLKWSDDSKQLTYTAVDADGTKKSFVVDPIAGTEQVQSSN